MSVLPNRTTLYKVQRPVSFILRMSVLPNRTTLYKVTVQPFTVVKIVCIT